MGAVDSARFGRGAREPRCRFHDRETEPDTRLDYFHHGYMPLRVIVTNDSDKPVELDQARILFVAADRSVANSATEDELQRRMFTTKQVQPTKVPLIPITIHHQPVDKKIVADMDDFGFVSTTVAPHSTAAGWLFYDVRDLDDPVLDGAEIEIRRVVNRYCRRHCVVWDAPGECTRAKDGVFKNVEPGRRRRRIMTNA